MMLQKTSVISELPLVGHKDLTLLTGKKSEDPVTFLGDAPSTEAGLKVR